MGRVAEGERDRDAGERGGRHCDVADIAHGCGVLPMVGGWIASAMPRTSTTEQGCWGGIGVWLFSVVLEQKAR